MRDGFADDGGSAAVSARVIARRAETGFSDWMS
jgi:hypothetical protein